MVVLDLFSGIGGFSLGLERAGMRTAAFCEINSHARLVLRQHWPDVPIFEDVMALTAADMPEKIDVICGGFPCQDISLAGKGAGLAGNRSGLWSEFHRLISEIRPSWVIVENVSALRSRGLDVVLGGLAALGYDAEWHCIPASAVGAPHRRDRVWIVAHVANASGGRCGGKESGEMELARRTETVSTSETVADANEQHRWGEPSGQLSEGREAWNQSCGGSAVATDTMQSGLQGQWQITSRISEELKNSSYSCWWEAEPSVGRVANGVPNRVDRLKQLGNAVVPQIPELIGRAIMSWN
jgi:DNA (cytosine-5)-methyltransferase 1